MNFEIAGLVLGAIATFLGLVVTMYSLFISFDVLLLAAGVVELITGLLFVLVFVKTPVSTWLESWLTGKEILDILRPGRRLYIRTVDERSGALATVGNVAYYLVPGTAFRDQKGFVHYLVAEFLAPSFTPDVEKALNEIKVKYGISNIEDLRSLTRAATSPETPDETRTKLQEILSQIESTLKRWGESFSGDSVSAFLANLSPQALYAAFKQSVAARTAKMRGGELKYIILLVILFALFIAAEVIILSHFGGGSPAGTYTVVEAGKKVVESNATQVLVG